MLQLFSSVRMLAVCSDCLLSLRQTQLAKWLLVELSVFFWQSHSCWVKANIGDKDRVLHALLIFQQSFSRLHNFDTR